MNVDLDDLKASCFEIAKSVKWQRKPQSVSNIQELADQFFQIASKRATELSEVDEGPQIVNRAVWYLSDVHASPPFRDNAVWFTEMLDALLEIALPNSYVSKGKPQDFLHDLIKGIKWSQENLHESDM